MTPRSTASASAADSDTAPLSEEIYRLISRSRRILWLATARALEAQGQSPFTWQVICYLVRNGATMQLDLAAANAQDPAGMSRLLEDLEARGLVRRRPDPRDRRRSLVEVTAKGESWYRATSPVVVGTVDEAMRGLSLEQRHALHALLQGFVSTVGGLNAAKGDTVEPAETKTKPKRAARQRTP